MYEQCIVQASREFNSSSNFRKHISKTDSGRNRRKRVKAILKKKKDENDYQKRGDK